jgi:mono/diheme cytochrome c family protein
MFSTEFIGRLHPLIVHIPIGILLFAFALILFQRFRRVEIEAVISFALLLGSISAVAACVAGWILAQSGEYDADLVFKHQWTGIATAALGFLAYFIKPFRSVLTMATVAVLAVAGHYGGNLTHGEDYLFPKKKTPFPKESGFRTSTVKKGATADTTQNIVNQQIAALTDTSKMASPHISQAVLSNTAKTNLPNTAQANLPNTPQMATNAVAQMITQKRFMYGDEVAPILENKCYNCHSATKKKGGLRLDTEDFIREGGKSGSVLTAGNPEKSQIYASLLLPEDDDDHMPPAGKPQLTPQEIATIHQWIKQGAPFQEVTTNFAAGSALPKPVFTPNVATNLTTLKLPKATTETTQTAVSTPKTTVNTVVQNTETAILKNKTEAAVPSVLNQLKQQNIIVSTFGEGSNYLMANFVNVKNYNSSLIDNLQSIGNQLVRVRLSNQPVSDGDVKKLSSLKNITRLNLEKTSITDAALVYLKDLPNLEQVNLYGTNITDKGLSDLAKCPNLKVVYLWQTKTTAAGIEQLKKTLPNVQVDTGGFQFAKPDTNKVKK